MANTGDIRAGKAYVELSTRDKQFQSGLRRAQSKLRAFGKAAALFGGGAIVAGASAAVRQFMRVGDQLDKMAKRTGAAVKWLSEMGFAAEQSGADIESLGKVLQSMNRRIGRITAGQGTKTQIDALKELGLSIENLARLSPEQRFEAIADAMNGYGDAAAAAGLAQRAFSTKIDALLPLLQEGSAGMARLRKEAAALNKTMTAAQAKAAAELTDTWNQLKTALKGATVQVGAFIASPLTQYLSTIPETLEGRVLQTLDKFAAKTRLTGEEASIAAELIRGMEQDYGELAAAVDRTTNTLEGWDEARKQIAGREKAGPEPNAFKQRKQAAREEWRQHREWVAEQEAARQRQLEAQDKRRTAERRSSAKAIAAEIEQMRVEAIEGEIAKVNARYDLELKRQKELGAVPQTLADLAKRRELEIAEIRRRRAKEEQREQERLAEERKRREEQEARRRLSLEDKIERARIKLETEPGEVRDLALLEQERRAALRDTEDQFKPEVRELYDLKMQQLLKGGREQAERVANRGTFNATRIGQMFGTVSADKRLEVQKEIQEGIEELVRKARKNKLVFA